MVNTWPNCYVLNWCSCIKLLAEIGFVVLSVLVALFVYVLSISFVTTVCLVFVTLPSILFCLCKILALD